MQDVAVAYYTRKNAKTGKLDLYYLADADAKGYDQVNQGQCPKMLKEVLEPNVVDYGITPRSFTSTSIVNVTINGDHLFKGWPHARKVGNVEHKVYTEKAITDFVYNACFNKDDKPFKSYLMFLLKENRQVTKVKGTPNGELAADATTRESYKDLKEFLEKNRITQEECNKP